MSARRGGRATGPREPRGALCRGISPQSTRDERRGAHQLVLVLGPLVLANRRVDLVPPPLRALLTGAAGELVRDGRPAVAVFSLRAGERTTGID